MTSVICVVLLKVLGKRLLFRYRCTHDKYFSGCFECFWLRRVCRVYASSGGNEDGVEVGISCGAEVRFEVSE